MIWHYLLNFDSDALYLVLVASHCQCKGLDIIKGEDLPELFDEQAVTVKFPIVLGCLALPCCSATAALAAAAERFGTLWPVVLFLLLLNMVPETKTFLLGFFYVNFYRYPPFQLFEHYLMRKDEINFKGKKIMPVSLSTNYYNVTFHTICRK